MKSADPHRRSFSNCLERLIDCVRNEPIATDADGGWVRWLFAIAVAGVGAVFAARELASQPATE